MSTRQASTGVLAMRCGTSAGRQGPRSAAPGYHPAMPRRGTGATGRRLALGALAASGTLATLTVAAGAHPSSYQLAAIAVGAVQAGLLAFLAGSSSKKVPLLRDFYGDLLKGSPEGTGARGAARAVRRALDGVGVF